MMNTRSGKRSIAALCACILCLAVVIGSVFALKAYADYSPPEALVNLWRQNHAVIGAINIPGTDIRYPILQHPSIDDYYLNICFDGKEGYPGSIYTNKMEGQVFDTFNTVIYGHNMADESYFGSLKYYNDESFRDAHREIDIYTPTKALRYDVFAVVTYDDRYITDRYRDEKSEDRMAFLRSLLDFGPVVYDDVSVGPDSHILTLSTCIGGMPNNRLLVLAALREPAVTPTPAVLPENGAAGQIVQN
jgi:sortase B